MLTVHHLRKSQSERIVWLCEELGIEYDLKLYDRRKDNMMAPDEYKALHPIETAPIITDGDFSLGESGAIVEYIAGRHGDWRLCPKAEDDNFAQHLFWFHFANGTFMTNVMMTMATARAGGDTEAGMAKERTDRGWKLVEDQLGKSDYLGGAELTTADIMMGFPLTTMRSLMGRPLDDRPNIQAYLQRIGARDAYRRAIAKAEPGMEPKLD